MRFSDYTDPDVPYMFHCHRLRHARTGSSKTPGPVGRALANVLLPVEFKRFVTEKGLSWMYDHHLDWDAPITPDLARVGP